jgi:hypothetical protein
MSPIPPTGRGCGVPLASTAFSGWQFGQVAKVGKAPAEGRNIPSESTPPEIAAATQRVRIAQWVTPGVTAVLIVLGAQQGEQQRAAQLLPALDN